MQYFSFEGGAMTPWRQIPPTPSPVPLQRGVYERPDPDAPGYVILEIWSGNGVCLVCSRITQSIANTRRAVAWAVLNEEDPMERHLKAV